VTGDARGWRMALVPDALINPPERARTALPDVLGVLEASGYGVLQLPPKGRHGLLLAVIADQVAEYAHHGYAVVAVGLRGEPGEGLHWRRLAPLLPRWPYASLSGRFGRSFPAITLVPVQCRVADACAPWHPSLKSR